MGCSGLWGDTGVQWVMGCCGVQWVMGCYRGAEGYGVLWGVVGHRVMGCFGVQWVMG